jgi:peptidoglycan/LPS O-acetylase OafA/YrhL
LVWTVGGRPFLEYFTLSGDGPIGYLAKNASLQIGTYGIYDLLLTTTPYGQSVDASVFNGSLWTLIYEWHCYMVVAVFVLFGILSRAKIVIPIVTALLGIVAIASALGSDQVQDFIPLLADPQRLGLTFTFLVGATIAIYSSKVPFDDRLGVLSGVVLLLTLRFGGFGTIGVVVGAYFLLYLAARLPKAVHWIGQKNDYSYGIYVYGFLAQQVLAFFGVHLLGYVPFVLIALIVASGCAWVSWHLVEKRAMALKDWGPGRGLRYWYDRFRNRRQSRPHEEDAEQP